MEEHLTTIAVGLAVPTILGIFGYLWKVNTRLTAAEKMIEAHEQRIFRESTQLHSHFDKAFTIRK